MDREQKKKFLHGIKRINSVIELLKEEVDGIIEEVIEEERDDDEHTRT